MVRIIRSADCLFDCYSHETDGVYYERDEKEAVTQDHHIEVYEVKDLRLGRNCTRRPQHAKLRKEGA